MSRESREAEINALMGAQQEIIEAERARIERQALNQREHLKREGLSGRLHIPHVASCRFCAARIVDLLPGDRDACDEHHGKVLPSDPVDVSIDDDE